MINHQEKLKASFCRRRTKLEVRLMVAIPILMLVFVLLWLLWPARREECTIPECVQAAAKFIDYIDPSVDPCENFYDFVCGNFVKRYSTTKQISFTVEEYMNKAKRQLKDILMEPPKRDDLNSIVLVKRLFKSCMDESTINDYGERNVLLLVEQLGGWPVVLGPVWKQRHFNWIDMMVKARWLGLQFGWFLDVSVRRFDEEITPKISLPENLDQTDMDLRSLKVQLMEDVAVHFGALRTRASFEMDLTLRFEEQLTQLVKQVKNDSLGFMDIQRVTKAISPQINWTELISNLTRKTIPDDVVINNKVELYVAEFNSLLSRTPKKIQANFFIWKTIQSFSPFLSKSLRKKFHMFELERSRTLSDRSDVCLDVVNKNLRAPLEGEYVRRLVSDDLKKEIYKFMFPIQQELVRRINDSTWMDEETKAKAINKTLTVHKIIGAPDHIFNTTFMEEHLGLKNFYFYSDNIITMLTELKLNDYNTRFSRIYTLNHVLLEDIYPNFAEINALMSVPLKTIILSAGLLKGYPYSSHSPNYLNYGLLGQCLSHELSHGLDNTQTHYVDGFEDLNGPPQKWITEDSLKIYNEKLRCLVREYAEFTQKSESKVNSSDNLSENLADFIAADVSYQAYKTVAKKQGADLKLPGLNYNPDQLFWIQSGTMWCYRKLGHLSIDKLMDDEHSQPAFRLIGPLRSSKYFARDFGCPVNSTMNPENKCELI